VAGPNQTYSQTGIEVGEWRQKMTKSLKEEIQSAYNGKNIEELKQKYGSAPVERFIENQLCVECEEFAEHFTDDEQFCAEHAKAYRAERLEIPSKHSDQDAWRHFGEQLANLDDSDVAWYESQLDFDYE
jgi:hypothetical protein